MTSEVSGYPAPTTSPGTAGPTPTAGVEPHPGQHPVNTTLTCQIWRPGELLRENATGLEVGETLRADPAAMAWIFLPREQTPALDAVAAHLGLDSLAIEDVIGQDEGTKLEWVGDAMVAVTAHVAYQAADARLIITRVSLLASSRSLVIMTDEKIRPVLAKALERARAEALADGIPGALHAVMDALVDSYTEVLNRMQDESELLAEKLFDDRPLDRAEQLRAFSLRRALGRLRRITVPMRDVTKSLANAAARRDESVEPTTDSAEALLGTRSGREFSDVADHAAHAATAADALREEITSMYETNLALSDVHLNTVMKKLAAWAAILAVPTLITGFMGMNVPYPGFGTTTGFVVGGIILVVAVVVVYTMFRRKDWL